MIRYLRGKVIEKLRNQLILDVGGVGYDVYVTPQLLTTSLMNTEVSLFVAEAIREDAHDLFGFISPDERSTFELLRKVSGVGPKVSMAIVSFYSAQDISSIVTSSDATKLSLVPGVGPKVAGKIVLELKGKVAISTTSHAPTEVETIEALQSLGYTPAEISKILPKIPATLQTTGEKITWALRHLAG